MTDVAAWTHSGLRALSKLPGEFWASLNPRSETEAHFVEGQLGTIRFATSLLHIALPLTGLALLLMPGNAQALNTLLAWFAALITVCAANEILFARFRSQKLAPSQSGTVESFIVRTRIQARTIAAMTVSLIAVWSAVVFAMWLPGSAVNHLILLFVLACTLGAVSSMLAAHTATATLSIALVVTAMVLIPAMDESGRLFEIIALPIVFGALMTVQAIAINRRVRRRLRLEDQNLRMLERLRRAKSASDEAREHAVNASRAKSEFLANMSHELRTPLNAILGFSDIIRTKAFGNSADKYSDYGACIHESGQNLLKLINDILELAKIDSGRKELRAEPVDVTGLVANAARDAGMAKEGVSVSAITSGPLPLLKGDPYAIRQILENLLSNAVKYTPAPGWVTAGASLNAQNGIEITITDTGIGIAPEIQAHLFAGFGRGQPDMRIGHRGTGLGLSIVRGLVDMHGARITVKSALGEGTSVTVIFSPSATLSAAPANTGPDGLRVA